MSKKHFIEFAKQIRAMRQFAAVSNVAADIEKEAAACERLVGQVANQFNPRFNMNRFREACKP